MAQAAQELQRYFFLTEMEPNYIKRIKEKLTQSTIFSHTKFHPSYFNLSAFEIYLSKQNDEF